MVLYSEYSSVPDRACPILFLIQAFNLMNIEKPGNNLKAITKQRTKA